MMTKQMCCQFACNSYLYKVSMAVAAIYTICKTNVNTVAKILNTNYFMPLNSLYKILALKGSR